MSTLTTGFTICLQAVDTASPKTETIAAIQKDVCRTLQLIFDKHEQGSSANTERCHLSNLIAALDTYRQL